MQHNMPVWLHDLRQGWRLGLEQKSQACKTLQIYKVEPHSMCKQPCLCDAHTSRATLPSNHQQTANSNKQQQTNSSGVRVKLTATQQQ